MLFSLGVLSLCGFSLYIALVDLSSCLTVPRLAPYPRFNPSNIAPKARA